MHDHASSHGRALILFLGMTVIIVALLPSRAMAQAIYPDECYETETRSATRTVDGMPMQVEVEVSETLLEECIVPPDNRINANDAYAAAAIYCTDHGVSVWDIDDLSRGTFTFLVPHETIADLPPTPPAPVLIAESGGFQLYRLASGELQLNSPPDWEGKTYVYDWEGCPVP